MYNTDSLKNMKMATPENVNYHSQVPEYFHRVLYAQAASEVVKYLNICLTKRHPFCRGFTCRQRIELIYPGQPPGPNNRNLLLY